MFGLRTGRLVLVGLLFIVPAAMGHAQKELVGEWQGTIDVEGQVLHLLWHVTATPEGTVVSTFDNVDEGAMGIKVKAMELKGSDITVTIDDSVEAGGQEVHVAGVLTGRVNADFSEVKGTWEQTLPQEQTADIEFKRVATTEKPGETSPKMAGE